jgi:hypothetical protein
LDGGEEVGGQHVVAGGDAAEVLEAPEHVLDGVAATVMDSAGAVFPAPVPLRWGVRHGTATINSKGDAWRAGAGYRPWAS